MVFYIDTGDTAFVLLLSLREVKKKVMNQIHDNRSNKTAAMRAILS